MTIQIIKKDKSLQNFNPNKIIDAIHKSADRACVKLTKQQEKSVVDYVCKFLLEHGQDEIDVAKLHNIVECALDSVDSKVAKCYRDYRNYKTNFYAMIDKVYQKKLSLNFIADRSNANADSALVTTQKAITYNELNTEFYKKFFLNEEERKASEEGYIYIHDKNARLDTINCFERATRFITSEGVKSFYDYKEGDELLVLSHTGQWRKAKVIKLPWSKLQTVTFTRGKIEFKVNCTPNHRWILKDGSITTDLKVGDKLVSTPNVFNWDEDSLTDYKQLKLWCLGFAFADGYVPKNATGLASMCIRLCGDKIKYADLFRKCGYTVKPKKNTTDLSVYMPDVHSKVLPYDMNHTNITSFMRGFISADGNKRKNLSNGRDNEYRGVYTAGSFNDWMYDFLNISGCYVTKVVDYSGKETNYGTRKDRSFGYSFYNSTSTKTWYVKSIDSYKLNPKANVWCLDVEEDHSFILEGGIPTGNCCLADIKSILEGGFTMGNLQYSEPKSIDVAFDLIADVTLNMASCQYGGFTIPQVDTLLAKYAEMSYRKYYDEYSNICKSANIDINENKADEYAYDKVKRDIEQGVQGWEMKLNSVASSRGDYPFTAVSFALDTSRFGKLISSTFLKVRKEGQGKEGFKRPVLFPKLSFFYDENLHGEGKELEWLFDEAIDCSSKSMYPDFIALTGSGYASDMYKKYGVPLSRMGCIDYAETVNVKDGNDSRELMIGELFKSVKDGRGFNYVSNRVQRIAKHIENESDKQKFLKYGYIWYDGELMSQWAKDFKVAYNRKPTRGDVQNFFGYPLHRKSIRISRNIDSSLFDLWDSYLELKTVDVLLNSGFKEQRTIEDCESEKDFVRNKVFNCNGLRKQIDIYFPQKHIGIEVQDFETHSRVDNEKYGHDRPDMQYKKGPSYHEEKREAFKQLGIDVYDIWEDDIRLNKFNIIEDALEISLNLVKDKSRSEIVTHVDDQDIEVLDLDGIGIKKYIEDIDGSFVRIRKLIKNKNVTDWLEIELSNSQKLTVTSDHPFITTDGQLIANELSVGQSLISSDDECINIIAINKLNRTANSYDVETDSGTFVFSDIQSHNCRASLSPWFAKGGMNPASKNDKLIFNGRFNMGAIALNFPMIVAKAKEKGVSFYRELDYYLELVRGLHKKTVEFLSHKKAGINPLGFCEGGFIGGHIDPDKEIGKDFLKPMTISFGIIALNEASVLQTGKSIAEDDSFAVDVLQYINDYINRIKYEDDILYAVYGVPGETAVSTLRNCFVNKYGIIPRVSDKSYFTNSFHCAVYEDITPIEKQDKEFRSYHLCNGGNIQYCRYNLGYNIEAIKTLVKRAMKLGYYEGVNFSMDFCNKCGHQFIDADTCPKCGTDDITRIERMNGYLGYAKLGKDKTYFNESKMQEFKDRVSM